MKQKLMQRTVGKLIPPTQGSRIVYDTGKESCSGFGLRITAAGVRSFILNYYVKSTGLERRFTIGRWPDWTVVAARDEARDLKREIKQGKDPIQESKLRKLETSRAERTMSDLAKDYMENYAPFNKRPSSIREDQKMLKSTILPRLGPMPLSTIGRREIESLHNSLKATPYQANRVRSLLSTMFNRAVDSEWVPINPVTGIPRYDEQPRKVWLSKEQLDDLKNALDAYPRQDAANAIRLLLKTGARKGEVLNAMWDEFDLNRGIWTKPSHHTKQKKTEDLWLSPFTLTLLKTMAERKSGPYLFPGSGQRLGNARVSLGRAWMQICKAAGLSREVTKLGKRRELTRYKPLVRIHDLRHTYASHLVSNGESLPVVGNVLGHTQSKTTERYSHVANVAQKKAVDRYDEILGW